MTLNLTQISKAVGSQLKIRESEVRDVLAAGFEVLTDAVAEGKATTISGFGSFRLKDDGHIDFRPGRHLKNGIKH